MKNVFLVFTLLFCYTIATAQTVNILVAKFRDPRSSTPPTYLYWRHIDYRCEISELKTPLDRLDASFKIVKGLVPNCTDCISFESVNYPGYFLRRSVQNIILTKLDNDTDKKEASFVRVQVQEGRGISYHLYNFPHLYIQTVYSSLGIGAHTDDIFSRNAIYFQEVIIKE